MAGLVPAIHGFLRGKDLDAQHPIGERSDAVLERLRASEATPFSNGYGRAKRRRSRTATGEHDDVGTSACVLSVNLTRA